MTKYNTVQNKLDLANGVITEGDIELPDSHYRICYRRAHGDWRLRDENTGELRHVANIKGDINLNWFDGHSHFFHDGPAYMDKEYTVELKNPVDIELARTAPDATN